MDFRVGLEWVGGCMNLREADHCAEGMGIHAGQTMVKRKGPIQFWIKGGARSSTQQLRVGIVCGNNRALATFGFSRGASIVSVQRAAFREPFRDGWWFPTSRFILLAPPGNSEFENKKYAAQPHTYHTQPQEPVSHGKLDNRFPCCPICNMNALLWLCF